MTTVRLVSSVDDGCRYCIRRRRRFCAHLYSRLLSRGSCSCLLKWLAAAAFAIDIRSICDVSLVFCIYRLATSGLHAVVVNNNYSIPWPVSRPSRNHVAPYREFVGDRFSSDRQRFCRLDATLLTVINYHHVSRPK